MRQRRKDWDKERAERPDAAAPSSDAAQPDKESDLVSKFIFYYLSDSILRGFQLERVLRHLRKAEKETAHPEDAPEGRPKVTITKPSHEWVRSGNGHLVWSSTDSCGLQWQAEQIAAALGVQLNREVRDKGGKTDG